MADILLIGAGKSATVLIDFLASEAIKNKLEITIADANENLLTEKTKNYPILKKTVFNATHPFETEQCINQHKIIISLLPPHLHIQIAKECIRQKKHLLTASYVDDLARQLAKDVEANKLLFLYEMGLDPGIDHMSAMKIIDQLRSQNAEILSFKSHCGGLIARRCINNPLAYKFSWNPANVINAGKAGAKYLSDNKVVEKDYQQVFEATETLTFNHENLDYYPNRDSLSYIDTYNLTECKDFIRTTLRYPPFKEIWHAVVNIGLATDDIILQNSTNDYLNFLIKNARYSSTEQYFATNQKVLEFLEFIGFYNQNEIKPDTKRNSLLQQLMENTMSMQDTDTDRVVMMHEIEYKINNRLFKIISTLDCEGENNNRTAMAKTVGLPLGIAAILLLYNQIPLTGLNIPTHSIIYNLVLPKLEEYGICFKDELIELK